MIGFSTANVVKHGQEDAISTFQCINENHLDGPFHAVIEAEEEAILNSMIAADTVVGYNGEIRYGLGPFLKEYLTKNNIVND
jgi:D-aminopeptidase